MIFFLSIAIVVSAHFVCSTVEVEMRGGLSNTNYCFLLLVLEI